MSSLSEDDSAPLLQPILEEPEREDSLQPGSVDLFVEDLSVMSTKLSVCEAILSIVTKDIDFHGFMREILLLVMKSVKSEAGSILEINHDDQTIFFRAAVGTSSDSIVKFVIPLGKGIVGHVAESKQPMVISDVGENRVHLKAIQKAVGFDARNMVALPIIVKGRVYGVIELLNRVGADTYTESDVELLQNLLEKVAKAIEIRLMISWARKKRESTQDGKEVA